MTEIFHINSPVDLPLAASHIARKLHEYPIAVFRGGMGAGKTTLIRDIARAVGSPDNVTSPTFAIINQYMASDGRVVNHFDFYRIDRIEEAFDLGYEEYFYGGDVCLVEWPEKIEALLPEVRLEIEIEVTGPLSRKITVSSSD